MGSIRIVFADGLCGLYSQWREILVGELAVGIGTAIGTGNDRDPRYK